MIPEITEISDDVIAVRGQNVTLSCKGIGEAPVNVSWVTPSGVSSNNGVDQGGLLVPDIIWAAPDITLYNISASDGGTYACIVENPAGSVNATVTVYVTPYFTVEPSDILTTNGSTENITCRAEAFPPPDLLWIASREGCTETVASGSGSSELLMYEHLTVNDTLVFDPVVFGHEDTLYCCVASNDYGEISTSISVTGEFLLYQTLCTWLIKV